MPLPTAKSYTATTRTCGECSGYGRVLLFRDSRSGGLILDHSHACPTCRPTAPCWVCRGRDMRQDAAPSGPVSAQLAAARLLAAFRRRAAAAAAATFPQIGDHA